MTDPSLYADRIAAGLVDLDGLDVVGLVLDATYTFDADHATAAELVAFELDGASYERAAGVARVERVDGAWYLFVDGMTALDLSDSDDRSGIAWCLDVGADADNVTIVWAPDPGDPEASYLPTWPDGVAALPIAPITELLPDHASLAGRSAADQHPISAITGLQAALDALEGGGGGGSGTTREVAAFIRDADMAGGSFTTVTIYPDASGVPRSGLVGASVLVTDGDDLGVWTVTSSGACTAGDALSAGEIVSARVGGWVAAATAADAVTVDGVTVAGRFDDLAALDADHTPRIEALEETTTDLGAGVDTIGNDVEGLQKLADESSLYAELEAQAPALAPTHYALCGEDGAGHWYCSTLPDVPTSTMQIRALACGVAGNGTSSVFQELYSIPQDSGGTPDTGGIWDWNELAQWLNGPRMIDYYEWTSAGGTSEWHTDQDPVVDPPLARSVPPTAWVERRVDLDLDAGIVYLRHRTDALWDYEDLDDSTRWRTTCTYDTGAPITLEDYTAVEQWIGRGQGLFHVARVRRWNDGVLVVDFDPSTVTAGSTTVPDTVLESAPGTPANWVARVDAETVAVPASGDGDVTGPSSSTDGHAVVFDGTTGKAIKSAGAAPVLPSRTLAGLDLSADRTAAALRSALALGAQALEDYSSMTRIMVQPSVGDWFSQPHGGVTTGTPTLNRLYYVPIWIPKACTKLDGIAAEVTTVASSSVCRLGLYAADATTYKPAARLIDGGTVDFSSGGGSAGIRTLSITATDVTPDRLYYVGVVQQGAVTAMRVTSNGESLRAPGYPSSTVADVFGSTPNISYYEASVSGALPSSATPVLGTNLGFAAPVVAVKRNT